MKTENYKQLYRDLLDHILIRDGQSSQAQRQASFNNAGLSQPLSNLIDKVAHLAYKVTDDDVNAAMQAGYTEDQLFELMICGAVGQASRQYESGLAALTEVMKEGGSDAP
jgi:alkylhydroperoxidase/carboxymuconolactone decarboxylase family protein YurZ